MSKHLFAAALLFLTIPSAATAADRRVEVVNDSDYAVLEFYASNIGTNDWEEDILGRDVLYRGNSVLVNIDDGTGYCRFDVMVVYAARHRAILRDVNVCSVSQILIHDDHMHAA